MNNNAQSTDNESESSDDEEETGMVSQGTYSLFWRIIQTRPKS